MHKGRGGTLGSETEGGRCWAVHVFIHVSRCCIDTVPLPSLMASCRVNVASSVSAILQQPSTYGVYGFYASKMHVVLH